jgi:hypothetical protein
MVMEANKINKLSFRISTGLLIALFIFNVSMYTFNTDMVRGWYNDIEFPTWIIFPSALIKTLGMIAIITRKSKMLVEWAYSGFFFDVAFAIMAHSAVGQPISASFPAFFGVILIVMSRIYYGKIYGKLNYSKEIKSL